VIVTRSGASGSNSARSKLYACSSQAMRSEFAPVGFASVRDFAPDVSGAVSDVAVSGCATIGDAVSSATSGDATLSRIVSRRSLVIDRLLVGDAGKPACVVEYT